MHERIGERERAAAVNDAARASIAAVVVNVKVVGNYSAAKIANAAAVRRADVVMNVEVAQIQRRAIVFNRPCCRRCSSPKDKSCRSKC